MTWTERLLNKFGYVKADINTGLDGATLPSDFPSSIPESRSTEDMNRVDLDQNVGDILDSQPSGHPGNISKKPAPEITLIHKPEEAMDVANADNPMALPEPENSGGLHTDKKPDISEHLLKNPNPMGYEELNSLNPSIARRAKKLGILFVDRDMFMKRYDVIQRRAMFQKKPVSELIDEIFKCDE